MARINKKTEYMVKIRLNEFHDHLIHYYSTKTNRSIQDICTDAIDQYLRTRLSDGEYKEQLALLKQIDMIVRNETQRFFKAWMNHYETLDKRQRDHIEKVFIQCLKMARKGKYSYEDLGEYHQLTYVEQQWILRMISCWFFDPIQEAKRSFSVLNYKPTGFARWEKNCPEMAIELRRVVHEAEKKYLRKFDDKKKK